MSNKSLFSRLRGLSKQTTGAKKAGGSTSNREIIEKLQKEEDAFRNKVITSVRIDREFAREDDIDLTEEEKNQVSHRARACEKMLAIMKEVQGECE